MKSLILGDIPTKEIEQVLALTKTERDQYFLKLIKEYNPTDYNYMLNIDLLEKYSSSWVLELLLRYNPSIETSFTAVYTGTGLIRALENNLYLNENHYTLH